MEAKEGTAEIQIHSADAFPEPCNSQKRPAARTSKATYSLWPNVTPSGLRAPDEATGAAHAADKAAQSNTVCAASCAGSENKT